MKKQKNFLLIEGSVYPFDTLITTAEHCDVIKYIEKKGYKLNDEEKEKLEMRGRGRTVMLCGGQTIIRLRKEKTKIGIDVSVLAHEISHATFLLFDRMGIIHTDASDEAFAYYQEYLMKQALIFFDP